MEPPQEITASVDPAIEEKPRIQTYYEALGNFREEIPRYLNNILAQTEAREIHQQRNSFYLNSSDSLESLLTLDLSGAKVMTVSGSGEFSHAFIDGGATEVISFDISPAAAFYSELRHRALCLLDMREYIELFESWALAADSEDEDEEFPLLNKSIFDKVQSSLSEEARLYFDLLFQTPKLINITGEYRSGSFARRRHNYRTRHNRLIGDLITQEDEYNSLQEKARSVKFTQVICDATTMEDLVNTHKPGLIYLSNIGYEPEVTIDIARKYIDLGVPEVICTVSKNNRAFTDPSDWSPDSLNTLYYGGKQLSRGAKFQYIVIDKINKKKTLIPIEVVGIDKNADYGLALKLVQPRTSDK